MTDGKTYTQADLDAAVVNARAAAPAAAEKPAAKMYYHLYVCPSLKCLKTANPKAGSLQQRGVHLAQSTPRSDVKCPGCGDFMVIARDGCDDAGNPLQPTAESPVPQLTSDANGNAVFHGRPIIQEAPGQPDQTADIVAENAEASP